MQLAKLRHPGCRKSVEEIAEQLSGHLREDHLFNLEQSLKMHDAIDERIQAYETEIQRRLTEMERVEVLFSPTLVRTPARVDMQHVLPRRSGG